MALIDRGGEYFRVADPGWEDPLDSSYSMRFGGRWNAPASFPVTYFNADVGTARANARRFLTEQLAGQPFSADDLDPSELPVLVAADVPADRYLDVVTGEGIVANGLAATYPIDEAGHVVSWAVCRPVGQRAWEDGLPGIAGRSAAASALEAEELAWFDRHQVVLRVKARQPFADWYGPFDW